MQEVIGELLKMWREERSSTQMTISKLVLELSKQPKDKIMVNLCIPHSYRGYYSDLAFELRDGTRTVTSFIDQLMTECLNKSFYGYKGGEFIMDENTPLWIAKWGQSAGVKIINIKEDEILSFLTKEDSF